MKFSIAPYSGDSPMKSWPSLASSAYCLKDDSSPEDSVFFYDTKKVSGTISKDSKKVSGTILVFIHGLGDEADSFRHLIPALASRGYRVLSPDLPGFGRSVTSKKINIKNHAAAVIKLIEAATGESGLSGETPPSPARIFLVGNSMGALIAELVAIKRPFLIHGLILIDGSIPGGPAFPGIIGLFKLLFSKKWYRAFRSDPDAAVFSLFPYYADFNTLPQEDREFLARRVIERVNSSAQERAFFATQRSLVFSFFTAPRFTHGMRKFKGKILLIWGGKDRIIPLSSTEAFMTMRPDTERKIIPGAGHLPHQEKPEETEKLIAEFVGKPSMV